MKVQRRERLAEFARAHRDARTALDAWLRSMEGNNVGNLVELKRTFRSADYVRPYTVFNISGNKYRLIALVDYELGLASVEQVLTHAEYDRGRWKH